MSSSREGLFAGLGALERDGRYYLQKRAAILAKQRVYNRRRAELLAEDGRLFWRRWGRTLELKDRPG
jgi:hypothetical protein